MVFAAVEMRKLRQIASVKVKDVSQLRRSGLHFACCPGPSGLG